MIECVIKKPEPVGSGEDAKTPYSHTVDVMLEDRMFLVMGMIDP